MLAVFEQRNCAFATARDTNPSPNPATMFSFSRSFQGLDNYRREGGQEKTAASTRIIVNARRTRFNLEGKTWERQSPHWRPDRSQSGDWRSRENSLHRQKSCLWDDPYNGPVKNEREIRDPMPLFYTYSEQATRISPSRI